MDMNSNKITNVADGTADSDAVNFGQLNDHLTNSKKQAFALNGTSSTTSLGTHTFVLNTSLTSSTNFMISLLLSMDYIGTFTGRINFTIVQLNASDSVLDTQLKVFDVNIRDIGSFELINSVQKYIISAVTNCKKIQLTINTSNGSTATKSYRNMLELELI